MLQEIKNSPLVSIVIPLFNAKDYIAETIESVLKQLYKNIELIVVDDCSTDGSYELVEDFSKRDSRVKLIRLEQNFGGPAKPRNIGVENSKGDYIAFLDADDIWEEEKLEVQIGLMEQEGYNFTSTNILNVDENLKDIDSRYSISNFLRRISKKRGVCDLIKNSFIATSSVVVKRDIIEKFSEDRDFISVEDLCLWIRLLDKKETKYSYISQKLVKYRVLSKSISDRSKIYKQETRANLCIIQYIFKRDKYEYIGCYYRFTLKLYILYILKSVLGSNLLSKVKR
jgi:teichuronic acid biosynthesis glycosyltransferase TuaG